MAGYFAGRKSLLLIYAGCSAPFAVEPDENSDRADFQRPRFQINGSKPLREVVSDVGSVIHRPADAGRRDDWPNLFLCPSSHGRYKPVPQILSPIARSSHITSVISIPRRV